MYCPNCGSEISNNDKFCPSCGERTAAFVEENQPLEMASDGKKKPFVKIISFSLAAVIVVGAAIFAGKSFLQIGSIDSEYVFLKDGKYVFCTDLSKDKTTEIGSSNAAKGFEQLISFSPNGEYLYFYTNVKDYYGTLCRVECSKIKGDSVAAENIEKIASNINTGIRFTDGGGVIYRGKNEVTYYCDGKDSYKLGDGIGSYYLDDSNGIVYMRLGDDYGEADLFYTDLSKPNEKTAIATKVNSIIDANDFNSIYYTSTDTSSDNDDQESLYVVGINDKEPKKIADKATVIGTNPLVFATDNGKTASLYDYVIDDFDEMSDDEEYYYDYESEDLRESLQDESYDINIKDIYSYAGGKSELLCENVLTYGYGKGALVYNTVDEKFDKIDISEIEYASDVNSYLSSRYRKLVLTGSKEELTISSKVGQTIDNIPGDDYGWTNAYISDDDIILWANKCLYKAITKGSEITDVDIISGDVSEIEINGEDIYYYCNETNNNDGDEYDEDEDEESTYYDLYKYSKGNNQLLAQEINYEADLGLMGDVYEDGSVIAYTEFDYDADKWQGELTLFDTKGEKTTIDQNVTDFVRLSAKEVLYISGDDAYLFNGKESKMIQQGAENAWSAEEMNTIELKKPWEIYDTDYYDW